LLTATSGGHLTRSWLVRVVRKKGTLLANWVSHHRAKHPQDQVFERYLGATTDSGDIRLILRRLITALAADSETAEHAYLDDEELIAAIPNCLARAGADAEVAPDARVTTNGLASYGADSLIGHLGRRELNRPSLPAAGPSL
jgi:hypothetical protein